MTFVSSSSISVSRYSPAMLETAPRASVETHDMPPSPAAALAPLEDLDGLHVRPLGVRLEVRQDVHDLGRGGLDHDLALGLLAHRLPMLLARGRHGDERRDQDRQDDQPDRAP